MKSDKNSAATKQPGSDVERILPNAAKSVEGKWYGFRGKFKIDEVKQDPDVDETSKQRKFRITIVFPTKPRKGIYPKELALVGDTDGNSWGCFGYRVFEKEMSKQMLRAAGQLRDARREIRRLKLRNHALERRFSQTAFENEYRHDVQSYKKQDCEFCGVTIDKEKTIEGKDWVYLLEEEIAHLECATTHLNFRCTKCGILWGDDHEEGCPECGGQLEGLSRNEVRDRLKFDALKKYLPEELRERVVMLAQDDPRVCAMCKREPRYKNTKFCASCVHTA